MTFPFYRCETLKCIGNWKSRESAALQSPTIESILAQRENQLKAIKVASNLEINSDTVTDA